MARPGGRAAWLLALALVLAGSTRARADAPPPRRTPWDQGRVSVALAMGSQSSFDHRYFVVGAGLGYFVLPGLEVAFHAVRWFGGDPGVTKVSPQVRYIVTPAPWPQVKPFVGGFYNHWFIGGDWADLDTVGARGGLVILTQGGLVLGVGATYERVVSACDADCWDVYPELSLSMSF